MPARPPGTEEPLGFPLDLAAARRDRLSAEGVFGADRVFPAVVDALLDEVPDGVRLLEVGAATGVLTRPLLAHAEHVTALEISAGMLGRLLETDVAASPRLTTVQGIVEDLPAERAFDVAVVTFTPRRGLALAHLLLALAERVTDSVVMLLEDDLTLDWAYLARAATAEGFGVRMRMVSDEQGGRRAVVLVADVANRVERAAPVEWGVDVRAVQLSAPIARGSASRLVREFMAVGDRALIVQAPHDQVGRFYGSLRTAAHREGAEIAVHRHGDELLLLRMPPSPSAPRRPASPEWE